MSVQGHGGLAGGGLRGSNVPKLGVSVELESLLLTARGPRKEPLCLLPVQGSPGGTSSSFPSG